MIEGNLIKMTAHPRSDYADMSSQKSVRMAENLRVSATGISAQSETAPHPRILWIWKGGLKPTIWICSSTYVFKYRLYLVVYTLR